MLGIYGNTWASQYGLSPLREGELSQAGKAWGEAISGLTPRHVIAGITAAQRSGHEFPPNAARFRILALGLPSLAQVEAELGPGQDRSPFSVLVWSKLDLHRYRTGDGRDQHRLVQNAYEQALRLVQAGEPLPPAVKAIAHEPMRAPVVSDRARARAAMERAAAELSAAFDGGSGGE